MITTLLLDIVNFFWYGLVEILWPQSIAGFDLNNLNTALSNVLAALRPAFQVIDIIIPITILFSVIGVIITLYVLLFTFKVARFFIGILRPGV